MDTKARGVKKPKASAKKRASKPKSSTTKSQMNQADIAIAAYYHAKARNFAPGQELNDWLAAEREINARAV